MDGQPYLLYCNLSVSTITTFRPHRLFGAVWVVVRSLSTVVGSIFPWFSSFVIAFLPFQRERLNSPCGRFSETRASSTLAHYSWLTQEEPRCDARCCSVLRLSNHSLVISPSRPSAYWLFRHGRTFLVIFLGFSVGNLVILE